jgi:formate hydrogenlyase subunit 4
VWSVLAFKAARARDRSAGTTYPALGASRDVIAVIVGAVLWAAFALYLHGPLIGTRPFA